MLRPVAFFFLKVAFMRVNGKRVLICSCEGSMDLDGQALAQALKTDPPDLCFDLCRGQMDRFQAALAGQDDLLLCCTQEAPLFLELAAERALTFVNIRENAGWSDQAAQAVPKIAALIQDAAHPLPPTPVVSFRSDGVVLALIRDQAGLDAAIRLSSRMAVSCLVVGQPDLTPPSQRGLAVFSGSLSSASGHLGAFCLAVRDLKTAPPSSRGTLTFSLRVQADNLNGDVIMDLTGAPPLFRGGRDGYVRADPAQPSQIERALAEAAELVGEFDKPRYVRVQADLCAHSRNGKTGCTRCLDACPSGAATPQGDHVQVNAHICSGHGSCASACPTGAITYDLPAQPGLSARIRRMVTEVLAAGGGSPDLLITDAQHGPALIEALARFGPGLPAAVLPLTVQAVTAIGLDILLTALAMGAGRISLLIHPKDLPEAASLTRTVDLAQILAAGLGLGQDRVRLLIQQDPLALRADLDLPVPANPHRATYQPMGHRRQLESQALAVLAGDPGPSMALPDGAPFGQVCVDLTACTLCLACVGACPTRALGSNPDRPLLSFKESACVQCGLCRATCPERAITLRPRLALGPDWDRAVVIKQEDPFACIRCGKEFGTKSTIERMAEKLAGHSMFQGGKRLDLIKMCDTCRVIAQMEDDDTPLGGPARPKPRTAEDYR